MHNGDTEGAALALLFVGIVLATMLAINVFVCWLLYRANEALPVQHRKTESWQAFLLLIPLFNLVWNFILFARISGGMQSYFQSKNDTSVGDCGANLGLWCAVCCIFCGPVWLVLLILYLVKVSNLRSLVLAG